MHARRRSLAAVVFACVGLGASVASLVDDAGADAAFCAESGCATVRASAWAHPAGVPMPLLGVAFFAAMLGLTVIARPRLRTGLALAGAAWALALIGVQAFALHAWCKLCMIADPAALGLAASVLAGARTIRWSRGVAALALPALVAVPVVFAVVGSPAAAPPPIVATALTVPASARGGVTVVEFVDFECPFCRDLAPRVTSAVAHAHVPVTIVRKMVPLPMHPHARTAALAWCCADAQGRGEAMAAALYAADPDALTAAGCAGLAAAIGCDMARYREALADPATAARIAADMAAAKAANVRALPTIVIDGTPFTGGNHTEAELAAAIDRA